MRKLLKVCLCFILLMLLWGTATSAKKPTLLCPERHDLIRFVSTGPKMVYKVDYVMHRESRCRQLAFNPEDPNGGSYGLFQINGYWCKPSRYSRSGWLQEQGVLKTCNDLYNPLVNAKAFMLMYDYAGWEPWGGEPWN